MVPQEFSHSVQSRNNPLWSKRLIQVYGTIMQEQKAKNSASEFVQLFMEPLSSTTLFTGTITLNNCIRISPIVYGSTRVFCFHNTLETIAYNLDICYRTYDAS